MRFTEKLTYANVVSTLCLFLLLIGVGGTAAYAHGMIGSGDIANNSIKSKDLKNNNVKSKDLKNNNVKSKDLKNNNVKSKDVKDGTLRNQDLASGLRGQVKDATSPWDTIPSGRTVTGRYYDTAVGGAFLLETVNLPATAPVPLADSDVVVTGAGGGGGCTGSYVEPTAPAGMVCVYHAYGPAASGHTFVGSNEHDRHVFYLLFEGLSSGYSYTYSGSWAYTAP